jgi:hypothetical protein
MIVFTFEVIANRSSDIGASQPNNHGRKLWNMLFPTYNGRICLLVDGVDKSQHELIMQWLKKEGFKPGSIDFHWETGSDNRLDRVRAVHAAYNRIDWYVDINPETVAKVLKEGIPTLLMTVPYTVRPEWDKPRTIVGWDEITKEIETQALKNAERTWRET